MVSRIVSIIALGMFVLVGSTAYAGVDPGDSCKEKKDKAAGKKAFDLLKAFGKNTKKSNSAKLAQDISKAQSKFTKGFSKADAVGPCAVPGDEADVEVVIDDCVDQVVDLIGSGTKRLCQALPATGQTTAYPADKNDGIPCPVAVADDGTLQPGTALAYVDNGDGTITDPNTGLMWEKKSDDDGLHDKDNTYVWSGDGSQETIWDWLDDVNAEDGLGLAGYSDWRIPSMKELQTISHFGAAYPALPAEFADVLECEEGCTGACCYGYWTSTTNHSFTDLAWLVNFQGGGAATSSKVNALRRVRAVRGGATLPLPSSTTTITCPPTTTTTTTTTSTTTTTLPPCGNGVLDGDEQCDPPDFGGATCASLGFNFDGTLGCTAACQYDVSGCECTAYPATGQTTCWGSSGIVIPCAGTGQDGEIQAGVPLAYIDNGNGTVTDLNTGLMWEKKSDDR